MTHFDMFKNLSSQSLLHHCHLQNQVKIISSLTKEEILFCFDCFVSPCIECFYLMNVFPNLQML